MGPRSFAPGITAILSVDGTTEGFEAAVLDLAAVLDGLSDTNFEIAVVDSEGHSGAAIQELMAARPHLPLRTVEGATTRELVAILSPAFDPQELSHLVDALDEDTDVVLGYRREPGSALKRLKIWMRSLLINACFGYTARDVDCAFMLVRRRAWRDLRPRVRSASAGVELIVTARRLGFGVKEVPVQHCTRPAWRNRAAASGVLPSEAGTHA